MKCECGFWDRDRPHSRVGGGVCEYAFRRKYAVDNTGDIVIPDEVVDLKLLLECRHERNVLQKICAERSDEIDRLRAKVEALRNVLVAVLKHLNETKDGLYADFPLTLQKTCQELACDVEAALRGEGEK